ncbi:phenylacetate--CoA ligase family protein [Allorhizocola rhizosphaerae]|uniref:phenylacetate--CoA ligase family protein n=1 Tax=Allorhizocola rhizosphaerae TaxID=1872709 RepID=UPI000E3EBB8F|nr:AMP-binding protein [Allorhizocola rhizosphaerae]
MVDSLPDVPHLSRWSGIEDLYRQQDERVRATLALARNAPYYRERLAGQDSLSGLPLMTKRDLRASYPFGMLAVPKARLATYHESSGTTGDPTPSFFTEADWYEMASRFARTAVDVSAGDTVLIRTPYAMLITAHQAHRAARLRGATVVPADNRSLLMPYPRVIRLLRELEVTVAWCLPSECLLWAAAARAAGLKPDSDFPALRAFHVAGEPLTPARRRRITSIWGGVPVFEDYGSTETGSLGGQCPAGRVHLWADRFLCEVYDPDTGRIRREGRGQLVITTLYREAMPLIRYNIEDFVEVDSVECPCGWRLPSIRVLGRSAEGFAVSGQRVTQAVLEELVLGLPQEHGVLFWRARAHPDRLEIEVEADADALEAAREQLRHAVAQRFGVACEVRALPPGSLVPQEILTGASEMAKPRNLFGPEESWDKAVIYS